MGQEYFINSQELEDKIRQLLPSQGGAGAGFDLSASTQIIPVIDVTESAEGSNLRSDLQSAISFSTATSFAVNNTTTTVITNTGYWRIIGTSTIATISTTDTTNSIKINDAASDKTIWSHQIVDSGTSFATATSFDFILFLPAGHSLKVSSNAVTGDITGSVRQIADIAGVLTAP